MASQILHHLIVRRPERESLLNGTPHERLKVHFSRPMWECYHRHRAPCLDYGQIRSDSTYLTSWTLPRLTDAKGGAHATIRMSKRISGLHGARQAPGTIDTATLHKIPGARRFPRRMKLRFCDQTRRIEASIGCAQRDGFNSSSSCFSLWRRGSSLLEGHDAFA